MIPLGPFRVEVHGRQEGFGDYAEALGHALHTLIKHMHAPGTVVLVHRPLVKPVRLTLHQDRKHVAVTL